MNCTHPRAVSALVSLFVLGAAASAQMVQASYPLLVDEFEATGAFGPVNLVGNPAPTISNGVCVDGVYAFAGGTDVQTPTITTFNEFDFQLDVEFNVTALGPANRPIWIAGNGWRFIGFYVQADGTLGMLYNNAQYVWSTTTVTEGVWYSGTIKFENGEAELYLDGNLVLQATLGPLNTGNNFRFTTNNFSNGSNFNGCIRNVVISNDTTLGPSGPTTIGTSYCTATPNSTGVAGEISATGSTVAADNDVTLMASNTPTGQFGIFVTSKTPDFVPNVGSGNLCVGGNIGRYQQPGQIQQIDANGQFSFTIDTDFMPQGAGLVPVIPGETWHFQAWHRDFTTTPPIMNTSNLTNAVAITFS